MKNNIKEVDYLRIIATATLVVWHCFYCPIGRWGMLEEDAVIHFLMKTCSYVIPDANMPLFTFISGYLFYFLYKEKGKYRDFYPFLIGKIKRLLIPFMVFGFLLPFTSIDYPDFMTFLREKLVFGEGGHLWYCTMLFWCFMFAFALLKLNNKVVTGVLCLFSLSLCCLYEYCWALPFKLPLGIGNACYYFIYFFTGGVVYNYKNEILDKLLPYRWYLFAGYIIISVVFRYFKAVLPFQTMLYALTLLVFVVHLMAKGKLVYSEKVAAAGKLCFGVYIFHHWLAWNICHCAYLRPIFTQHYILFSLALIFVVGSLSIVFSYYALKTRLGRELLA